MMTDRRSDNETIEALRDLLSNIDDMTSEEIDAELKEYGYDPEKIGAKFQTIADESLKAFSDLGKAANDVKSAIIESIFE